ncbi:MAG: hypothetical protein LBC71_00945 [Oscillospiraceae bacterium]|jgi:hypothetical protein|nr:hypothetical protein [Oscillospiraceae bacterium]
MSNIENLLVDTKNKIKNITANVIKDDTHDNSDLIEIYVKKQFDNLDMMAMSAIAIMLSDSKMKSESPFITDLKKPDIKSMLLRFCKDTYDATDIRELNKTFNKTYYKKRIRKYLSKVVTFAKRGISDSIPKKNTWLFLRLKKARKQKNIYIERICETINSYETVKYISALSGNEEVSDSKQNYKLDHLSENYKDALIYLVDVLLTCTCITKVLFVERAVKKIDTSSEFYHIIDNMVRSIDSIDAIINNSRPIYKQYYQSELGFIEGDDPLYGLAVTIMVNKIKKLNQSIEEEQPLNYVYKNINEYTFSMLQWLDGLARDHQVPDIGALILHNISKTIKNDYNLLINAMEELTTWENHYNKKVIFYSRERDKERYLKGDFFKEMNEISVNNQEVKI